MFLVGIMLLLMFHMPFVMVFKVSEGAYFLGGLPLAIALSLCYCSLADAEKILINDYRPFEFTKDLGFLGCWKGEKSAPSVC